MLLVQVNALDSMGKTCLHRAGREGNLQACRILLTFGIDPSIVSLQVPINQSIMWPFHTIDPNMCFPSGTGTYTSINQS